MKTNKGKLIDEGLKEHEDRLEENYECQSCGRTVNLIEVDKYCYECYIDQVKE